MSQQPQPYSPYTDKERLIRIETLINTVIESQVRLEASFISQIKKLDARIDELENTMDTHLGEDGKTYRGLRYKIVEFVLLAILGIVIGYLARG
jgi:hypothetical protein